MGMKLNDLLAITEKQQEEEFDYRVIEHVLT